jgi:hypothetical protein
MPHPVAPEVLLGSVRIAFVEPPGDSRGVTAGQHLKQQGADPDGLGSALRIRTGLHALAGRSESDEIAGSPRSGCRSIVSRNGLPDLGENLIDCRGRAVEDGAGRDDRRQAVTIGVGHTAKVHGDGSPFRSRTSTSTAASRAPPQSPRRPTTDTTVCG